MAPEFHEDEKAISKQAEAGNEANADYPGASTVPPPQLPDLTVLNEQQEQIQGGSREPVPDEYDDVTIADDGSRSGAKPKAKSSS